MIVPHNSVITGSVDVLSVNTTLQPVLPLYVYVYWPSTNFKLYSSLSGVVHLLLSVISPLSHSTLLFVPTHPIFPNLLFSFAFNNTVAFPSLSNLIWHLSYVSSIFATSSHFIGFFTWSSVPFASLIPYSSSASFASNITDDFNEPIFASFIVFIILGTAITSITANTVIIASNSTNVNAFFFILSLLLYL